MMKFGMMACCVVMVLPIVFYLVAGGTLAGLTSNLAVWAPLILCAGAHLLMFKLMGKSCHGSEQKSEMEEQQGTVVERPTDIPSTGTRARVAVKP
ncbi:MAG: DUF2933 domain-containing protein [Paracoccaceae bacterium]